MRRSLGGAGGTLHVSGSVRRLKHRLLTGVVFSEHVRHCDDETHSTQPDMAVPHGTHSPRLRKYPVPHEVHAVAEVHVVQPGSARAHAGREWARDRRSHWPLSAG